MIEIFLLMSILCLLFCIKYIWQKQEARRQTDSGVEKIQKDIILSDAEAIQKILECVSSRFVVVPTLKKCRYKSVKIFLVEAQNRKILLFSASYSFPGDSKEIQIMVEWYEACGFQPDIQIFGNSFSLTEDIKAKVEEWRTSPARGVWEARNRGDSK